MTGAFGGIKFRHRLGPFGSSVGGLGRLADLPRLIDRGVVDMDEAYAIASGDEDVDIHEKMALVLIIAGHAGPCR